MVVRPLKSCDLQGHALTLQPAMLRTIGTHSSNTYTCCQAETGRQKKRGRTELLLRKATDRGDLSGRVVFSHVKLKAWNITSSSHA